MKLRDQTARGLKWQMIEIGGRQVFSLLVLTILARLLDPADFGLLGMVAVYLSFSGMFMEQGVGTAIVQRRNLLPEHLDAAFWFNLVCACVLTAATVAMAGPISILFDEQRLEPLLRWGSLTLVAGALSGVHGALLVRELDFRRPAIRTMSATLAGGIVGIGMAAAGCGVWSLIGQQLTASTTGAAMLWFLSSWRPRATLSFRHLRDLLAVSIPVFSTGLLWLVASRADQFFIGRGLGTEALGHYVVGGKLADVVRGTVSQPLAAVSMPTFCKVQDDHERLRRAVINAVALSSVITLPAFLGLSAVAPTIIPLVFGERWAEAGAVLRWLALYQLLAVFFAFPHPALVATGNLRGYVIVNIVCAAGAVIACSIGVSVGVKAVVAGLIINLALTGFMSLLFLSRRIGLTPWMYCRPCLGPLAASFVMVGCVLAVQRLLPVGLPLYASALVQIAVGVTIYAGMASILAGSSVLQVLLLVRTGLGRTSALPPTRVGV